MSFTVGSLFDGSGGFPLAAFMCGGVPVWASEVEPYPIAVTKTRFPHMKHLGSVTDIKGGEIEPVDVVCFGSPCQDLSVAGLRKGIKHESNGDEETTRSGLFMEAVRIIREMREATNGAYPRFALWENVPGAFSSNKGEDFRIVLEELIKTVEPEAVMPPVPEGGWPYADCYLGDGWSLAYRVLDAQYWGVPQRRRRIYLVLDLGGECAGEVLFERHGLRGYFAESRTPWEGLTGDAEGSSGTADCKSIAFDTYNMTPTGDVTVTLRAGSEYNYTPVFVPTAGCVTYCGNFLPQKKAEGMAWSAQDVSGTLHNGACPGFQNGVVLAVDGYNQTISDKPGALRAGKSDGDHVGMVIQQYCLDDQGGSQISVRTDGKAPTLRAEMHGNVPCVMESAGFKEHNSANAYSNGYEEEIAPCLSANNHNASVCIKGQYLFENHSQDARYKGPLDVCPMLPAQLGTGGNNTPFVVTCIDGDKIGKADRAGGSGLGIRDGDKMYTLTAKDAGTHSVCIPIHDKATRYQGGGPTRNGDGAGNGLGVGADGDPTPTLSTCDRHIVCYGIGNGQANQSFMEECVGTLNCMHDQQAICYGVDCRNFTENPELYPTLQAKPNGGQSLNYSGAVRTQYIVRRLTPTECARLQGFLDKYGHPDTKTEFTDEEYRFWLDVRNTHAAINGKVVKPYTKDQMLKWYNKLHTDSSEYKMWGNGIALPTALYVMQGIADVLN